MSDHPEVYGALADLLSVANIILFAGVAVVSIHDFYKCNKLEGYGWCWIKIAQAVIGLYFSVLYVWVLFADPNSYNPVNFGRIFVRPAQTVLAGLILASTIIRSKNSGTFPTIADFWGLFCRSCRKKAREKNNEC